MEIQVSSFKEENRNLKRALTEETMQLRSDLRTQQKHHHQSDRRRQRHPTNSGLFIGSDAPAARGENLRRTYKPRLAKRPLSSCQNLLAPRFWALTTKMVSQSNTETPNLLLVPGSYLPTSPIYGKTSSAPAKRKIPKQ